MYVCGSLSLSLSFRSCVLWLCTTTVTARVCGCVSLLVAVRGCAWLCVFVWLRVNAVAVAWMCGPVWLYVWALCVGMWLCVWLRVWLRVGVWLWSLLSLSCCASYSCFASHTLQTCWLLVSTCAVHRASELHEGHQRGGHSHSHRRP